MFGILVIADVLIVAVLVFGLCKLLFGDSPISRLLSLLFSVAGGFAYLMLLITVNDSATISFQLASIIFFAPVALVIILCILGYMFK